MTDPARANPAVPKTILIVEDNSLNMKLFSDVLTSRGYRVIGTSSGLAAKQMAAEALPDLILMDIQLSEVSGYDVIDAIKADELTRDIPVIAVTAYAMREDERRVRSMGCASYISKPIFIGPFVREIEAVLAGGESPGGEDDPEDPDDDASFVRRPSVVLPPDVSDAAEADLPEEPAPPPEAVDERSPSADEDAFEEVLPPTPAAPDMALSSSAEAEEEAPL